MQNWFTENGFVLACSALKESDRQIISVNLDAIHWIYKEGSLDLIWSRVELRQEHFMKS
jgi:gluconate kinase